MPGALSPEAVHRLNAAADRLYEEAQQPQANGDPSFSTGGSAKDTVTLFRSVARDDAFLDLVDHPTTFPFLWDIMGWNIQHYSEPPAPPDPTLSPTQGTLSPTHGPCAVSQLIVYPPEPKDTEAFHEKRRGNGWHIDGGRPVPEMEERPQPRLSLKIGYFFSVSLPPAQPLTVLACARSAGACAGHDRGVLRGAANRPWVPQVRHTAAARHCRPARRN